jgi:hypothetical protein
VPSEDTTHWRLHDLGVHRRRQLSIADSSIANDGGSAEGAENGSGHVPKIWGSGDVVGELSDTPLVGLIFGLRPSKPNAQEALP